MCVNSGTHCTPGRPWKEGSPTRFLPPGGLGSGGYKYISPAKPSETVRVIKGYTNTIELN